LSGLGLNWKEYVPAFHAYPPASVIVPETVVDCPKAESAQRRLRPSKRTAFMG
jgi:hypothetical protein